MSSLEEGELRLKKIEQEKEEQRRQKRLLEQQRQEERAMQVRSANELKVKQVQDI